MSGGGSGVSRAAMAAARWGKELAKAELAGCTEVARRVKPKHGGQLRAGISGRSAFPKAVPGPVSTRSKGGLATLSISVLSCCELETATG